MSQASTLFLEPCTCRSLRWYTRRSARCLAEFRQQVKSVNFHASTQIPPLLAILGLQAGFGFFFFCAEAEACQQHKHQSLHLAVIDTTGRPQATPSCDVTIGSAIAHPRVGARATRRRLVTLPSRWMHNSEERMIFWWRGGRSFAPVSLEGCVMAWKSYLLRADPCCLSWPCEEINKTFQPIQTLIDCSYLLKKNVVS